VVCLARTELDDPLELACQGLAYYRLGALLLFAELGLDARLLLDVGILEDVLN
jgi:hypothetical protein